MLNPNTGQTLATLLKKKTVSGEELATTLGISRAAVWKHIETLRELGYDISSVVGVGYTLLSGPDLPLQQEVHQYFTPRTLGKTIHYLKECASSNTELKAMADKGSEEGTVVVSDYQTAGRGRRGRTWLAAPGEALLFSLLLRPPLPPQDLFGLTLVAGVALATTLDGMGLKCGLKWPNDILVDGKKICGILAEVSGEIDHTDHVILGIGLNIQGKPSLEGYDAASLAEYIPVLPRAEILARVLISLEEHYNAFCDGKLPEIITAWKDLSVTIGQRVVAHLPAGSLEGVAKDLSPAGGLIVQSDAGELHEVTFGEVTLRAPTPIEKGE